MYWVIHYSNGVAITRADSHQAAKDWCLIHLGNSKAPFAITPARKEDMQESSESVVCIDRPGFSDDRAFTSFLVGNNKLATRH